MSFGILKLFHQRCISIYACRTILVYICTPLIKTAQVDHLYSILAFMSRIMYNLLSHQEFPNVLCLNFMSRLSKRSETFPLNQMCTVQ